MARQTCTEFEWVIVPNGDVGEVRVDLPQARVVPYEGQTQNIDELKHFACLACRGEQNGFIQTETLALHHRYIYPLVERWCDLKALWMIDLCGGFLQKTGQHSKFLRTFASVRASIR